MARIRRAQPVDSLQVAHVHVRAWQVGYRGLLPQQLLDDLRRARTGCPVRLQPGLARRTCDLFDAGEVWAFYVDPGRGGAGVGRRLMHAARDALRTNHFRHAALWVMADNSRARRFYEHEGWHADGDVRTATRGAATVNEVRYRRGLD